MSDSPTLYERVGGTPFFQQLVADFYAGVATDPVLSRMYPAEDMTGAAERLTMFFVQYWGGPKDYQAQRGHPRLRMRHNVFTIDATARDAWLHHMLKALEGSGAATPEKAELHAYIVSAAEFLVNSGD